jgi:type IX secretion system PorP/SprF family membrane protein
MKKTAIILMLIVAASSGFAQQDPILTQYMFNKLAINPAYAGSTEALSFDIIDRFQWVGIKDAPNTISFTGNSSLPNKHLGVGLYTYRDAVGPTIETGLMGSFAYRILFPKGTMSFGAQFGFTYLFVDWEKLNPENPDDPLLNGQVSNHAAPDAGVGLYWYSKNYYVGVSSTHLLQNKILQSNVPDNEANSFSKLMRHFYGMAGVVIPVTEYLDLRPSLLVKYVQNAPVQADLGVALLIRKVLWIGASYRTENCLSLTAEVNVVRNIHIGYAYDAWFNQLSGYNKGSHEIRLGIDLDILHNGRFNGPRYF